MIKINFLCQWSLKKKKTWSGTCYSLLKSLSKITNVRNINYNFFFYKIFIRLGLLKNDLGARYIKFVRLVNKKIRFKEKDIVFQFDDYANTGHSYKYIDSSLGYLIHLYNTDYESFMHSNFRNISIEALKKRYEIEKQYFHTEATGIFTMSKWLRNYLIDVEKMPPTKVHYAGGGINVDATKINWKSKNGKRFLFIGRDFERKGGQLVIESFKKLQVKYNDIELYVAGPKSDPVKEVVPNYYFQGDVDSSKLFNLYNLCDYFVMPSYFEMYGLVFIEALTFGLPCIGRNCYEMPNFIEDGKTGFLLKNDDPDELFKLMENLLFKSEIKENVIKHHDIYLKEYSWDEVAKRIYNVMVKN